MQRLLGSPPRPSASFTATPPRVPPGRTGSSLLDTLLGIDSSPVADAPPYLLLRAVGDEMRVRPPGRPAAQVDVALPDLLRRVAAGVRLARGVA